MSNKLESSDVLKEVVTVLRCGVGNINERKGHLRPWLRQARYVPILSIRRNFVYVHDKPHPSGQKTTTYIEPAHL